jgi:hypothetical protein
MVALIQQKIGSSCTDETGNPGQNYFHHTNLYCIRLL